MGSSAARSHAAAFALLLCWVSVSAADAGLARRKASAGCSDALPSLESTGMNGSSSALAGVRHLTASLEGSSVQTVGPQREVGARRLERRRSLAATISLRVPKSCPKKGCFCPAPQNLDHKSACSKWVCCAKNNAFEACTLDRILTKMCTGKPFLKSYCSQLTDTIQVYGKFLNDVGKKAAQKCKAMKPYNTIVGQVKKDLENIKKRCC